ncbi:ROK family transcriptional regulator [Pseudonocardia cypriaca]|uniref:Putative NBD/HSP70 family sugar kinase n=1 Tax=Pseudonocardia cypriaca TaxID=882449 RepID=A0A543FXN1_9PSEU|nr:ROK family transcriptional regulator [Pseudonocardia cypriaca]TQM38597.1 putative NBD/HSP70 family sugar kinase [Pseudonocardia cypriaca]
MSVPAGQHTVRRHNLALVLGEVAGPEPLSRAAVAARTGLTRGTVSSLVEELIAAGLVTELAAARGGPGRPASPLRLDPRGPAGLGLEVGVDTVGACVVDLTGAVRAQRTVVSDHRDDDPDAALARLTALADDLVAETGLPIAGATVALPGVVGPAGVLERAPNLPRWVDVAVGDALSTRLHGLPVRAGNEADLAALAERWAGGPSDAVVVSGGIGVGAGILLDGALFAGGGGRAGEIGHVVVEPDGQACHCGGRGCLETVAGLEALAAGRPEAVGAAGRALGIALTGAVHLLDVPAVVLGGSYPGCGPPLLDAVRAELTARVFSRAGVEVRFSTLGPEAALRGAATAVVQGVLADPGALIVRA